MKRGILLCLLLISACGCFRANTQPAKSSSIQLSSGSSVEILAITVMHFADGSQALMLKYQTTKSIEDTKVLRKEAGEVWDKFRSEVEKKGFKNAILSANDAPKGFIFTNNSTYNFVFDQKPDGSWHCSFDDENDKK